MTELLCNYAILRFLPYKDICEFVNAGVAVHCPEIDFFDYRLATTNHRRVRQFFPELDRGVYKSAMEAMDRQLQRYRSAETLFTTGRAATENDIARGLTTFRMLLQRREALLHFAAPGTLLSDPRNAADELFKRYVERHFAHEPEYQEDVMRKNLNRWMKQWGIRDLYQTNALLGDELYHLRMPFVRMVNSRPVRAVKPLDLIRQEPTKIFEHGDLWIQRIRRLRERKYLPDEMIFPVRVPLTGDTATAANQVLQDLERIPNVKWFPFEEGDIRLKQSLAV